MDDNREYGVSYCNLRMEAEITSLPASRLPVPESTADYNPFRGTNLPIVIDNGSTTIKYGFSTSQTPHTGPNLIAKYRDRRTNRPILLFGDAVDAETGAKSQSKSPWEGDVLLNFDALVRSPFIPTRPFSYCSRKPHWIMLSSA